MRVMNLKESFGGSYRHVEIMKSNWLLKLLIHWKHKVLVEHNDELFVEWNRLNRPNHYKIVLLL